MKKVMLLSAVCLLLSSCNRDSDGYDSTKPKEQQRDCPKPVRCCPDGQVDGNDHMYNDGSYSNADWQITMSVKKAIMTDSNVSLSARFVSVSTTNGVVTLSGTVSTKDESRMIERKAKSVSGVRSVDNQLTISQ